MKLGELFCAPGNSVYNRRRQCGSGNFAQFNNTNILQVRRADYNSIEFNRTYNGWDVVRASLGLRTILYNEQYDLLAAAGGRASQSVENVLIGPQIGLDIYYPLSNRLFTGARFKGGVYLDIASSTSTFGDTNFNQRRTAEDEEISGVFEVGSKLGYQVTLASLLRSDTTCGTWRESLRPLNKFHSL